MKLTNEELDTLREIIWWWRNKSLSDSPRFDQSNSKTGSFRMGIDMFNEAESLAKSSPNIRTISRLVNILVWEWLGKPDKFLVESNTDEGEEKP